MFIRTERSVKEFIQFYPIVAGLVIINLVLWLIIDFLQLPIGSWIYQLGVGSNYYIEDGQYWRLFTPIFLHAGLMHVLFNSFALVLFGPALEQMLGKFKFIVAYIGAGVAGNLGTYILGASEIWNLHLGASGAVYGLFGMYVFMIAFRQHLIDPGSRQIVMVIFIVGLIMTFVRPNINIYAHIFGFIGGFAIAQLVLTNAQPFSPWRNQKRRYKDDDAVQFDPQRWKKKRIPQKMKKNIVWIVIGGLVLIGVLSRLNLF
ncbi:membrane associated rhomboid family serine protease [Virgibacillus natechei]|uniref:Membrane associated rhomboid family serine protease n=1 Tax=Virgibacillus natechei TaxID=1216297 RepID=A0ABS4IN75_9BACI|nr:rhomboid family intramembrane serine protease [Virgibacillus natechei]MBP1971454.1 membrane associated rhomboid family serine protease [Virgibacillus natechei]UZD13822.1 rhomboid family intramembrane serine protease [Virgibacillus natechei]